MPLAVSIDNMEACVRRELGFRRRVYPRWVAQTKLRAEDAAVELERMEAILEALEELRLARAFMVSLQADGALDVLHHAPGVSIPTCMAWKAWTAPRHAPLTTGTHNKEPA